MPPPEECPDSQRLASFLEGREVELMNFRLEEHLVRCTECFHILCEAASTLLLLESRGPSRDRSLGM